MIKLKVAQYLAYRRSLRRMPEYRKQARLIYKNDPAFFLNEEEKMKPVIKFIGQLGNSIRSNEEELVAGLFK